MCLFVVVVILISFLIKGVVVVWFGKLMVRVYFFIGNDRYLLCLLFMCLSMVSGDVRLDFVISDSMFFKVGV